MSTKAEPKQKMKWRPAPAELIRIFEDALKSLPEAEPRKMFGYPCSFINGQMFAGLHQENMILRLPEEARSRFLDLEEAKPFEPMPGRVMGEYVVVPRSVLNSAIELKKWLGVALTYAKSLPPKPPGKKGSRVKEKGKDRHSH